MDPRAEQSPEVMTLRVVSPAFGFGGTIPIEYTCEGADIPPPLSWTSPPPGTKSIAVIVEDPDAPNPKAPERTWTHWIVTGVPADVTTLDAGGFVPEGTTFGTNDYGQRSWNGPCPPIGRHRYFFKVYALDIELRSPGITRLELLAAMKGHILARGELIGTYEKKKPPRR
ncbi:MAG: hypothetical protein JWO36_2976 [Myxococcales bacterium]|nr:hypothetical protein [Myxococcales bacterium]